MDKQNACSVSLLKESFLKNVSVKLGQDATHVQSRHGLIFVLHLRKKHHKNKTMVCDFEMFHVVKQTILFVIMFLEASNFICLKEVFAMIDLKGDMFC